MNRVKMICWFRVWTSHTVRGWVGWWCCLLNFQIFSQKIPWDLTMLQLLLKINMQQQQQKQQQQKINKNKENCYPNFSFFHIRNCVKLYTDHTHHVTQKFPQWLQEMVDIVKYMSSICLSTAKYKENKYIINGHNFIDIVKIIAHLALGTMFFTVHWLAILEQLLLLETFGA